MICKHAILGFMIIYISITDQQSVLGQIIGATKKCEAAIISIHGSISMKEYSHKSKVMKIAQLRILYHKE